MKSFNDFIIDHKLTAFYPPGSPYINELATKAPGLAAAVQQHIGSQEAASQIVHLALYKLVILLGVSFEYVGVGLLTSNVLEFTPDDSGSMQWYGGTSIQSLRNFLNLIVKISSIYLEEGVSIRWLNHPQWYDGVRNNGAIDNIINWNPFYGWTKIGQALRYKILDPLVLQPAYSGYLQKPVVVMMITDGEAS